MAPGARCARHHPPGGVWERFRAEDWARQRCGAGGPERSAPVGRRSPARGLAPGDVLDALTAGRDERHHRPQLGADLLDRVGAPAARSSLEAGTTGAVLGDPLLGEGARPGSRRGSAASRRGRASSMTRGPRVRSPYSAVSEMRVAHAGDALLVHEVDDELELVEALEVGRLRLVAGLDERLEAGLDERGQAPAEHDLLAEEVGLGLLGERGLEDAGAGRAEGVGVGEGERRGPCPRRPGATAMSAGTPPPSV